MGSFRAWLRQIVGHVLQEFRRRSIGLVSLPQIDLEDPSSDFNQFWDAEHDRHVLSGLMNRVPGRAGRTARAFKD